MTTQVRTVATQAFQIWLRPDEPALGWDKPGATVTAYVRPFETWASMPQTLWAEEWPDARPAAAPSHTSAAASTRHGRPAMTTTTMSAATGTVHADAADYIDRNLGLFFPNAVDDRASRGIYFAVPAVKGMAALGRSTSA